MKLVVIGGVAGGASAAARAKRTNPTWEVMVFEKGPHVSYGSCGLPYYIGKVVDKIDALIARRPSQFKEQGIDVFINSEVKAIDFDKREVEVFHKEEGSIKRYGFDSLVIATGANPVVPPLPGMDLEGVFVLRTLEHGMRIRDKLEEGDVKRAVIVGGGFIGMEMCEALSEWGIEIVLVELLDQILPPMDKDMADLVRAHLEGKGIKVLTNHGVEGFLGDNRVKKVVAGGEEMEADMVILAIGVRPNVSLAKEAGVKIGKTGAIATNERMETNVENVYAAGDCTEAKHILTGDPVYIPLGTTANKQGRVAGTNAVGGSEYFKGVLGTAIFKSFDIGGAMTGLTEKEALRRGIPFKAAKVTARDRARYYPGSQDITIKLLYDPSSGRILGCQIVGHWSSIKRIDTVSAAIYAGMGVEDLYRQDFSYSPPFSPVWDPLLIAADRALKT